MMTPEMRQAAEKERDDHRKFYVENLPIFQKRFQEFIELQKRIQEEGFDSIERKDHNAIVGALGLTIVVLSIEEMESVLAQDDRDAEENKTNE